MNKVWGVLGNPTKEQIDAWMNMPYGKFKDMVKEMNKKSKGKVLKKHKVKILEHDITTRAAYYTVDAFDSSHALSQVKEIDFVNFEWGEDYLDNPKYTYQVCGIEQ